jgi:molybdopterin-binding protein
MADESEIYFEITIVGTSAKVVALDAATGVEVVAIAPAKTSVADLKRLALGKLRVAIAREAETP